MKAHHKIHTLHYLILILVLVAGLALLFMYSGRPELQFWLGVGIAISYFFWGMIHHYLLDDLHRKHVVEYGMIAILAVTLLKIVLR